MFGFLKFLFLCALAIAAGVAAVSVPVAGRTVAAHVQAWVGDLLDEPAEQAPGRKAAKPAAAEPAARTAERPAKTTAPKPRPPESDPTAAERTALENLIGAKTSSPPGPGR